MYIALIVYFAVLFLVLLHRKKSIIHPSVSLCGFFLLFLLLGTIYWDLWDLSHYSVLAGHYIILGSFVFVFVGLIVDRHSNHNYHSKKLFSRFRFEIVVPKSFLILNLFLTGMICTFVLLFNYKSTGSLFVSNTALNDLGNYPALLLIGCQYLSIQAFFMAILMANNIVYKKRPLYVLADFLCILFAAIYIFSLSSRTPIIKIFVCFLIALYIFKKQAIILKDETRDKGKILGRIITFVVIGVIGVFSFYFLGIIKTGGKIVLSNFDFKDFSGYIAMYTSSPIKLFEMYVTNPQSSSHIWGEESFSALLSNFNSLGLKLGTIERHLEFRGLNGNVDLGNVYGAFRRYLNDFGVIGLCVLTGIESFIFHELFVLIRTKNRISFALVIFCFIYASIIMIPIDDVLFSEISIGFVRNIIILYIMYYILIKQKRSQCYERNNTSRRIGNQTISFNSSHK